MIDILEAILSIDWLRMLLGVLIGGSFLFSKRGWVKFIAPVASVLIFHGLNYAIRWYHCPLDLPLWCKCTCDEAYYQPIRLAEIFGLSPDYLTLWLIVAVVFLGALIFGLWLLWDIRRELRDDHNSIVKW